MAKTYLRWKIFCFLCLAMSVSLNSSSASAVLLPPLKAPTIPDVPAGKTVPLLDASNTEKLSAHIWMIPGYPNIPIIVGKKAVLVVDTGLGNPAAHVISEEVERLALGKPLYLTTTHFHPEHAAGFGGFPSGTKLLRPSIQENELNADKGRMFERFRIHNAEALSKADYGKPELFKDEKTLDLGDVHARIFWAGPAHTYGDTLVYVPEDRALVTGDVVQNLATPTFLGGNIGPEEWLHTLQIFAPLKPKLVIPDHSPPGPGEKLISDEEAFMTALITETREAKKNGLSEDDSVEKVTTALHAQFPDWIMNPLTKDGIRRVWKRKE
ncbi:MBL fold metallo-hydrolase [Gluconobacter cerinus]|uniref:MBL fold metallo-hydrolase n=1 Tax=Gluconobacter cerinus TaxID=38307 RepID=UPI001B8D92B8|nr:MBL fold metallo-hydrolase [Gluconobacter cerinus]MBS1026490.1 MBL fold metallo-hydrolase [Gluconobacter cerinus]MBS1043487.1 MBL fold metallo-hydrolase [Gluconobacter cerinus]